MRGNFPSGAQEEKGEEHKRAKGIAKARPSGGRAFERTEKNSGPGEGKISLPRKRKTRPAVPNSPSRVVANTMSKSPVCWGGFGRIKRKGGRERTRCGLGVKKSKGNFCRRRPRQEKKKQCKNSYVGEFPPTSFH